MKRLVVVADRGLLSLDKLQMLSKLKLPGDRTLEFILAVPGRWLASSTAGKPERSSAGASSPTAAPRRGCSTRCARRT